MEEVSLTGEDLRVFGIHLLFRFREGRTHPYYGRRREESVRSGMPRMESHGGGGSQKTLQKKFVQRWVVCTACTPQYFVHTSIVTNKKWLLFFRLFWVIGRQHIVTLGPINKPKVSLVCIGGRSETFQEHPERIDGRHSLSSHPTAHTLFLQ